MKDRHAKGHKKYVKKKKFNIALILPLFLVFIMVASMFGYVILQPSDDVNEYNGYKFTSTNDGYVSYIGGEQYLFNYLPQDVEKLNLTQYQLNAIKSENVYYITYDPDYKNAQLFASLQYNLEKKLSKSGKIVIRALTKNMTNSKLPVINCNDPNLATKQIQGVIISFDYPEKETDLTVDFDSKLLDNCIKISSYNDYEYVAYVDRIFYEVLGVYD